MKLTHALLFASTLLPTLPTSAQSWLVELDYLDEPEFPRVAASEGGRVAVVWHTPFQPGITFLDSDGTWLASSGRGELSGSTMHLADAEFIDEDTLLVCGTLDFQKPYCSAIDASTGLPVWDLTFGYTGQLERVTRGSLGDLVLAGEVGFGTTRRVVLTSVSAAGVVNWSLELSPSTTLGHTVHDIETTPDGDLLVALSYGSVMMLSRRTPTGDEVWTQFHTTTAGQYSSTEICATPDGDVLLTALLYSGPVASNVAWRVDPAGQLEWAYSYDLPLLQGYNAALGGAVPASGDGLMVGIEVRELPVAYSEPAVMRLRADGSIQWIRSYGQANHSERAPALAPIGSGGFVAASKDVAHGARIFSAGAGGELGGCGGVAATGTASPITFTVKLASYQQEPFIASVVPGAQSAPVNLPAPYTLLCSQACSPASSYCTAKQNSAGCYPTVGSTGSASTAGLGLTVTAQQVLNQKQGLLFWGRASTALPFQGGTRCVASPLVRTPAQSSGGSATGSDCTGQFAFAFDQAYMTSKGIEVGDTIHCQYWYRDPQAPFTTGLSDALQFTVCP